MIDYSPTPRTSLRWLSRLRRHCLLAAAALGLATAGVSAVQAQETLIAGGTPSGIPFTFLDVSSGKITGAMVDLIEAVGQDMGAQVEIKESPFNALIPSLTSGKIDIISAAMLRTPERAKVVSFSDDVYPYGEGVIVKRDHQGDIHTLDDLKGQVVGAQVGTTYVRQLQATGLFPEIRNYDTLADMMRDVSLGRIVAGIGDAPVMAYQLKQGRFADLELAPDYQQQMVGEVALAVAKDNTALLERVNASLARLKANGKLDAIFAKWGL